MKNLLLIFFLFISLIVSGQEDTTRYKPAHSPTLASVMSAIVPGAGQVYNKKYWKIPIIYGLGGYLAYSVYYNNKQYMRYKEDYKALTDNDPNTIDEFNGEVPADQLKYAKDQHRRQRDLAFMGLSLLYVLNIVDASVDAHLYDFDISDDLSLKLFDKKGLVTLSFKF